MAAVTQYEHDWRFQRLLAGGRIVGAPVVLGVAKAGLIFSGASDTSIQPYSGDQGSSLGFPLPMACRAVKLFVAVVSNDLEDPSTVTLMKNEADTDFRVTIPAASAGTFSASGSVDYAEGDRLQFHIVTGGTDLQSIDIAAISLLLLSL